MMRISAAVWAIGLLVLAACGERRAAPGLPDVAPSRAVPAASAPADSWAGRWHGPEGTFLDIRREGAAYQLTLTNLDGPRSYPARLDEGTLRFEREGKAERLRPVDGDGTGMKWLAGKRDCVAVAPGEGFCRD